MFLFAIRDSQQPASSIGFLLLKLLPLPCALLLVLSDVLSPGALRKTRCIKEGRVQVASIPRHPATTMVGCVLQHTFVDPIESFQISHWFAIVFVDRPLLKH